MFSTAVGLPFAVGHGRGSTGHFTAFAAQFAEHFTGVGELAGDRASAGCDHGNAQQRSVGFAGRADQRATCPWQQQHHADGEPDGQAWHQLPPVQAHFEQGPDGAGQQYQAIQAQGDTALSQQQDARQGKTDTGDQVVKRSTQLAQLDAAGQQGQAHQQQQRAHQAR